MNQRLTNLSRFAVGFDFTYSMTFPLGIHSVRIRKDFGVVEIDTPNKGKMFRWDRRFQVTISWHNRWAKGERHGGLSVDRRYLERPVGVPFHPEVFDSHGASLVFSIDRKSTRLNSSHLPTSRMPSSA